MLGLIYKDNTYLIGISFFIFESQQLNLQKHQHLSNVFSKAKKLYSQNSTLVFYDLFSIIWITIDK